MRRDAMAKSDLLRHFANTRSNYPMLRPVLKLLSAPHGAIVATGAKYDRDVRVTEHLTYHLGVNAETEASWTSSYLTTPSAMDRISRRSCTSLRPCSPSGQTSASHTKFSRNVSPLGSFDK